MPRIELIPDVYYNPQDPYHYEVDNVPLRSIVRRLNLVNLAVDNVIADMREAIGTQGSLSNRLAQSIDPDGSLIPAAIDAAQHTMDDHTDTDNYVRMSKDQSDKLTLIADEATDVKLQFTDGTSDPTLFDSGVVEFQSSDSVSFVLTMPNIIQAHLAYPTAAAHQHYYNATPVAIDQIDPDYINYQVDSIPSAYISGSLRVYINGTRIFSDPIREVYAPGVIPTDSWTKLHYTEDNGSGTFVLSSAITEDDVIIIDYDISFI